MISSPPPMFISLFFISNSIPPFSKFVNGILCPSIEVSILFDFSKIKLFLFSFLSSSVDSLLFSLSFFAGTSSLSSSFCSSSILFSSVFPYKVFIIACGAKFVFCFPILSFIFLFFRLAVTPKAIFLFMKKSELFILFFKLLNFWALTPGFTNLLNLLILVLLVIAIEGLYIWDCFTSFSKRSILSF